MCSTSAYFSICINFINKNWNMIYGLKCFVRLFISKFIFVVNIFKLEYSPCILCPKKSKSINKCRRYLSFQKQVGVSIRVVCVHMLFSLKKNYKKKLETCGTSSLTKICLNVIKN